jgi:hypothetical protein
MDAPAPARAPAARWRAVAIRCRHRDDDSRRQDHDVLAIRRPDARCDLDLRGRRLPATHRSRNLTADVSLQHITVLSDRFVSRLGVALNCVERFEAEFDQHSSRVIVGVSSSQPHKAGVVECESNYNLGGLERIAIHPCVNQSVGQSDHPVQASATPMFKRGLLSRSHRGFTETLNHCHSGQGAKTRQAFSYSCVELIIFNY